MSKFIQLAEAQDGNTAKFDFTSRQGKVFHMEISVHVKSALIRKDGLFVGSVEYDAATDGYIIYGCCNTPRRKWIQLFIEETDREDSLTAPAWRDGIINRYQKRINDAQIALALAMKNLSNI